MNALGDPTRRAVFESLRGGPRPVGEIARHLPVSRPAVSQHLRTLKDAGLVKDRQEGSRRLYEVDRRGLAELRQYIDQFWDDALARFKAVAEAEQKGRKPWRGPQSPRSKRR
ncbi:MAG TPA: metalloregulator ArsR/SmtB family transcription factor [Actinomycetota bacterium]